MISDRREKVVEYMNKKRVPDIILFSCVAIAMASCFLFAYLPPTEYASTHNGISSVHALEDASDTLGIDAIRSGSGIWVNEPDGMVFRGLTRSTFWIRFAIDGPADPSAFRYVDFSCRNMDELDVYFPGHDVVKAGKTVDVRNVPIQSLHWYIPIPADYVPGSEVYVRVKSITVIRVPLRVIDAKTMMKDAQRSFLGFGLLSGVLAALLIVNLCAFVLLGRKLFITYSAYLFFLILYNFRVQGIAYMVPMPYWALNAMLWVGLSGFGAFMVIFAQQFMNMKRNLPRVNAAMDVSIGLFGVQAFLGLFISPAAANSMAYVTGLIVPLMILASVVWLYVKGRHELTWYIAACCAMVTATVIWATIPYRPFFVSSNAIFMIGMTIDSLLFTLSIFHLIKNDLLEKEALKEREKYYMTLSRVDSLTGLYNRRYLDEIVKQLEAGDELPTGSSLIMIDLDNFKSINDTYGHLIGDIILTGVASKVKKRIRRSDIACRYGGDEFLILLPGARLDIAKTIANDISKEIISETSYSEKGEPIQVTASIGITESRVGDSFDGMFLRADAALYQAKGKGRNRVSIL